MDIKSELLNHARDLEFAGFQLKGIIKSFDSAGFDWGNVTDTQLETILSLHPLRFYNGELCNTKAGLSTPLPTQ